MPKEEKEEVVFDFNQPNTSWLAAIIGASTYLSFGADFLCMIYLRDNKYFQKVRMRFLASGNKLVAEQEIKPWSNLEDACESAKLLFEGIASAAANIIDLKVNTSTATLYFPKDVQNDPIKALEFLLSWDKMEYEVKEVKND